MKQTKISEEEGRPAGTYSPNEALARTCARGILCGFNGNGEAFVDFPDNAQAGPVSAITTIPLTEKDLNSEAILLFEDGDLTRPILIGLRQGTTPSDSEVEPPIYLERDGHRLTIAAQEEIVLRCGKASIHLKSDGSIRIRGIDIVSRASATNRVRGGNVQIN